jgi:hypothetical protein
VAVHPLRPATDRRFGEPLPHQLANQTRAHPSPINLWQNDHVISLHYGVLLVVSHGYPPVKGRLPTRYSPVRRCPSDKSTEASLSNFPLDLHVLGTPPAFILSQDRTLDKIRIFKTFRFLISSLDQTLILSASISYSLELLFSLEIVVNLLVRLVAYLICFCLFDFFLVYGVFNVPQDFFKPRRSLAANKQYIITRLLSCQGLF